MKWRCGQLVDRAVILFLVAFIQRLKLKPQSANNAGVQRTLGLFYNPQKKHPSTSKSKTAFSKPNKKAFMNPWPQGLH